MQIYSINVSSDDLMGFISQIKSGLPISAFNRLKDKLGVSERLLINPLHSDFAQLKIGRAAPFNIDPRINLSKSLPGSGVRTGMGITRLVPYGGPSQRFG